MNKPGPPVGVSDQQEIDRRVKKGAEVWELKLNGYTTKEIAEKTGVPLRTVQHWVKSDREELTRQMEENVATDLALTVSRNESIYKIAMKAIEQTVNNEDGTQQVFMDHKSADIALKALKEIARLKALGAKEASGGEGTLEELILQSLQGRAEVKVIEGEIVEEKDGE